MATRSKRICHHNKQKFHCRECQGNGTCPHSSSKQACRTCSPVYCVICEKTVAKYRMKQHIAGNKHNAVIYKNRFWRHRYVGELFAK